MDRLAAISLLVALLAAGAGAVAAVVTFTLRESGRSPHPRLGLAAVWGGTVALVAGAVSAMVGLRAGHGAASPAPMGLVSFVVSHPAYLVVLLLAGLAFGGWWLSRRELG